MEPNLMLIPLAHALTPVLILLALGLPVVAILISNRYFALRTKELELESGQNTRELVARVNALEMRQGAVEKAVMSLSGVRHELLEAPPVIESAPQKRERERP